jgi:hypothetical protein
VACSQPYSSPKPQSTHCQELISSTRQTVSYQHCELSAASTGSPPGMILQFQLLLDSFLPTCGRISNMGQEGTKWIRKDKRKEK